MYHAYFEWIRCHMADLASAAREDGGQGGMSDEVSWTAIMVAAAIAAATAIAGAVVAKASGIAF
ncbi:hypothetical protein [Glycomyces sp. MUSA5-2]|uniref:hypothetical protein n=1 Tax=Glycomyces sp. MUSA5-2 TaxID=2053002 RepID=UPI00300A454B